MSDEHIEVCELVEDILCRELDLVKCPQTYDTAVEIVNNLTENLLLERV